MRSFIIQKHMSRSYQEQILKRIKKYTKVQVSETETMTMAEIKKMQKKLALLEEENIILKKAMAIFSRESGKE